MSRSVVLPSLRTAALVALVVSLVAGVPLAGAVEDEAPIRARADADLVHLQWGEVPGVGNMIAGDQAVTSVAVDRGGITAADGASAVAAATERRGSTFGQSMPLGGAVEQTAPADNAEPAEADAGGDGVLRAHARDIDVVCAGGLGELTAAEALTGGGAALPDPIATAGRLDGASWSSVRLDLDEAAAPAVVATAGTSLASLTLLDAVEVRVIGQPELVATASGLPGGASVAFTAPVVQVLDAESGEELAVLDAASPELALDLPPNSPYPTQSLLELRLGAVHEQALLDDGTHASAEAEVLQVRWKEFTGTTEQTDLRIGALSVSAAAPAGGLDGCARVAPTGCAAGADRPHAVVFHGHFGFQHLSIPKATALLADLANEDGALTLEVTDDPGFVTDGTLDRADVLILPSTTGAFPWDDDEKAHFERWVTGGGGVVGIHAASDANYGWPLWGELIGGQFQAHPHTGYHQGPGDVTVFVEDDTHPATAPWHGQESFAIADEIYKMAVSDDVDVLLTLDETSVYPFLQHGVPNPLGGAGPYDERQPLAWTHTFRDSSRVFYTSLGHNEFVFARDDFRAHVAGGLAWVLDGAPCATPEV